MRKIHNYIMLLFVAFAVASCAEEEIIENKVVGKPGEEVKFSLSLGNGSRTVYEEGESAFPIYWVDGDKVKVYSPHAAKDRDNAEYKVILPENVEKPNYAEDLVKTGDCGVQWGEGYEEIVNEEKITGLHDFYSIYPSGNYAFSSDDDGNVLAPGVRVNASQTVYYEGTDVNSQNNGFVHAMSNCLMYAYTPKVDMSVGVGVVDLSYNPLSTVLWVEMKAADAPEIPTGDQIKNFKIFGITLTSSEANIAGDFTLNVGNGSLHSWTTPTSGTKSIDITLRDKTLGEQENYTLNAGQTVKFPVFIAPVSNWGNSVLKIAINTDQGTFTKTITSNSSSLKPGKIHKIKLPELNVDNAEEWDVATWMRYIPRNVYLSEVSIPGTWNSLNVDCQSDTSIKNQYAKGVRAFHIDTRWRADNKPLVGSAFSGNVTKPNITALSVAVGGSNKTYSYEGGNLMRSSSALTFSEYLAQVTGEVKDDEYMVVFCTFSQNSYNGDRCPSTWYEAVSTACAGNDKVYDASSLTSNTVVGDVLGHVIVVVNLDVSIDNATLPADSRCLFTYVPMQLPKTHYDDGTSHIYNLYNGTEEDTGISMYTSHAQISTTGTESVDCGDRGYSHLLTNRDDLVTKIWDWSKGNVEDIDNYAHNQWIYLGLGGYIMNSSGSSGTGYDTVENRYAPMIYNRIDAMGKNNATYYPMGIILMNNKMNRNYIDSNQKDLGYDFSDVCRKILLLNNDYNMQYDKDKPADYDPNYYQPGSGDGEGTEGGDIEL